MKIKIRKIKKTDVERVHELVYELAVYEKEPQQVTNTVEMMLKDGFGPEPIFGLFVAEVDGRIVGLSLYYYRYSTWKGKTIHLEDLIVKEAMRGSGVGFALYKAIMAQGKQDQVRRIEWNVLDWNTPAIDFYVKSGAKVLDDWRVAQMDEEGINYFLENKLK